MSVETLPALAKDIADDIRAAYLSDDRPWVVGYSGGKDSSAVAQFVFYALLALPESSRTKKVYVLASDTRVELPTIVARVDSELALMAEAAERHGLPIETHKVSPSLDDSFWVNLIGRGYPSPKPRFRWCTDRLKIRPTSRFILERINEYGAVVIVLGSRMSESSTRAQIMTAYRINGQRFRPHSELPKAWVYTPIENLTTDDVWMYLLQVPSPWNGDNRSLAALYKRASGGECPLVIDTSTPSCGNSRFGCWVCTVVQNDRSMEGLVDSGEERFEPMLALRDFLTKARENEDCRMKKRRNGTDGLGPFTYEARREILKRVFEAQQMSGENLIGADEMAAIAEIWAREGQSADAVRAIWRHVYEGEEMTEDKLNGNLSEEDKLLEQVCGEHNVPIEMMRKLRDLEEEFGALKRRHGLPDSMREVVKSFVPRD